MGMDESPFPFLFLENYKFAYKVVRNNHDHTRYDFRPEVCRERQNELERFIAKCIKQPHCAEGEDGVKTERAKSSCGKFRKLETCLMLVRGSCVENPSLVGIERHEHSCHPLKHLCHKSHTVEFSLLGRYPKEKLSRLEYGEIYPHGYERGNHPEKEVRYYLAVFFK